MSFPNDRKRISSVVANESTPWPPKVTRPELEDLLARPRERLLIGVLVLGRAAPLNAIPILLAKTKILPLSEGIVLGVGLALFGVLVAMLTSRVSIVREEGRLIIQNALRKRQIECSEIAGFGTVTVGYATGLVQNQILLRTGQKIRIDATIR